MEIDSLNKDISELSPIQREAVEYNIGSLCVLAGPGSGKTRILTCRIANILNLTPNKSFKILALTFTNKAADEIRKRIIDYLPEMENRLFIGTFHSFCAEVLRKYGYFIGIKPNFNIYDKKEITLLYKNYGDELIENNVLDFDSLILKTHELFTKYPNIAKSYRRIYKYLCIDEFQDTNLSQYNLIHAFTGNEYNNVFIVADDDQIIYQWNGASYKRIEEFKKDYSPKEIQLSMNYRCPPEIITMANNLISHNSFRTLNKKPIESFRNSSDQEVVRLLSPFNDFDLEVAGIATDIRNHHLDDLGSVVILGRNRRLLEGAKKALDKESLGAIILQRKENFESIPFRWLSAILNLANDSQNQISLESVCETFTQLTKIKVNKCDVIDQAKISNKNYLEQWIEIIQNGYTDIIISEIMDKTLLYLVQENDFISYIKFVNKWFNKLVDINNNKNKIGIDEVFEGYKEELTVWNTLVIEITKILGDSLTLSGFLQELQMHSKEPALDKDKVTLMTIHKAKGGEFNYIYIIGLVDGILPSYQSLEKGNNSPEIEEERRNCFVAITRTIKTLTLSYAKKYDGNFKNPSRFIKEMGLL